MNGKQEFTLPKPVPPVRRRRIALPGTPAPEQKWIEIPQPKGASTGARCKTCAERKAGN